MEYLKPIAKKLERYSEISQEILNLEKDSQILPVLLTVSSEIEIAKEFKNRYGMDLVRFSGKVNLERLSEDFDLQLLRKANVLPVKKDEEIWTIAITDITDDRIQEIFRKTVELKGGKTHFVFAFPHEVEEALKEDRRKEEILIDDSEIDSITWVDEVIKKGLSIRASDIHIEPLEKAVKVRYRVDGSMMGTQIFNMSPKQLSGVYIRLKVVSNMDISEKRRSQDGRIDDFIYGDTTHSMRVSTVNTVNGEKFVMRIFDENKETVSFEELGFSVEQVKSVKRMLKKSNGIVYLAGATGSGKTTTLYSMIEEFDKDALNIYTIESPVEKRIENVNQIQIDKQSQNTYPSVMKTLLRQDPDVMVVGEIREAETAEIAVQASLTGHLVLTTIHANNALDSVTRLSEFKIESYLLGASSVGFLSQRLVRVLCKKCKHKRENLKVYEEMWIKNFKPDFDYEEEKAKGNYIYSQTGCDECVAGYKGRVAILEIIEVDERMRELISLNAKKSELQEHLDLTGYKRMEVQSIDSLLKGITSVDEVMAKLKN